MSKLKFNFDGSAKRCDINLRAKYIGLSTTIYKLNEDTYMIYCDEYSIDFKLILEYFNNSIRIIGFPIHVSNIKPIQYEKIISNIEFDNITSKFEGLAIQIKDIISLFYSNFYYINFGNIYCNPQKQDQLIIEISDDTTIEQETEIIKFIDNNVIIFIDCKIIRLKISKLNKSIEEGFDPLKLIPNKNLECSIRDTILWFDNIEKIYNNEFKKDDLYFYEKNKSKCFVNCQLFDNINLRNHLLLYDIIYCSLPVKSNFDNFLVKQNLTKEELLELAFNNRIKFVLLTAEKQYDMDFLSELYNINPCSIITERAINTLIACDIVDMCDNYIFNDSSTLQNLSIICDSINRKTKLDSKTIFSLLSWPLNAKLDSLRILTFNSPSLISNFGINNILDMDLFNNKKNAEFEFMINSHNIHIANSLDATYFPFFTEEKNYSDSTVSNIVGALLNFYKNSNPIQIETINTISKFNFQERNSITLLDIRNSIDILKYHEYSKKYNTTLGLKDILNNLEKMNTTERYKKIRDYNNLVLEINENCSNNSLKNPSKIIDYFLSATGFIPGYIGTLSSIISLAKTLYMDFNRDERKKVSHLIDKISEKSYNKKEKDDIYMLSKIDRVATLKFNK